MGQPWRGDAPVMEFVGDGERAMAGFTVAAPHVGRDVDITRADEAERAKMKKDETGGTTDEDDKEDQVPPPPFPSREPPVPPPPPSPTPLPLARPCSRA